MDTDTNEVKIAWRHSEYYCKFRCYLDDTNTFPLFVGTLERSLRGVSPEYITNTIYATLRGELDKLLMDEEESEETDCSCDCEECEDCDECEMCCFDEDESEEETFAERTDAEIDAYMEEAEDLVWLIRKRRMFINIANGKEKLPPADIMSGCVQNIHEICKKYNVNFGVEPSEWTYGYWCGILAALRWVCGEDKDTLDT